MLGYTAFMPSVRHDRQFRLWCIAVSVLFWVGTVVVWSEGDTNTASAPIIQTIPLTRLVDAPKEKPVEPTVLPKETEKIENSQVMVTPERVNLDVPFTSQAPEKNWEEPWQDACEEAVVLMVDAYTKGYGLSPLFAKDEILKMVAWQDARGWGYSISAEQIQQLMEEYSGLKQVRIVENPSIEEIKTLIAEGKPVLVVADGKALPNPHFQNGGPLYHALVIRGYTEDSFITNDPGTQFGENFLYAYSDLMNAIHDWNDGDVPNGEKIVLVVE